MPCHGLGSKGQNDDGPAGHGITGTNWTSPRLELEIPGAPHRGHELTNTDASFLFCDLFEKRATDLPGLGAYSAIPSCYVPHHLIHRGPPYYRGPLFACGFRLKGSIGTDRIHKRSPRR